MGLSGLGLELQVNRMWAVTVLPVTALSKQSAPLLRLSVGDDREKEV